MPLNFQEEGGSYRAQWEAKLDAELEYLEAWLAANAGERDAIHEKLSELYESKASLAMDYLIAEMNFLCGCLRSSLDEMYDIRERIEGIAWVREVASVIDRQSLKALKALEALNAVADNPVPSTSEDPISVGREQTDAVADDSMRELSVCPRKEFVAFQNGAAISVDGFPILGDAFNFPDWHPFIRSHVLGDFVSEILQLRIYVVIRLRYQSLKMSRIKWRERIVWNLLSAFR